MGLATAYRDGTIPSPEGSLYQCESSALAKALARTQGLYQDIVHDAHANNETIDPFESGMRLQKSGIWAVRYSLDMSDREVAALRLTTAASHYGDVQYELDEGSWLPEEEYAPRVHNNCVYNGVIKEFGTLLPETKLFDARKAMAASRWIVGHEGRRSRFDRLYTSAIYGSLTELWGQHMVEYLWSVDPAETVLDLMGVDALMRTGKKSDEAICIDFAASEDIVRRKCGSGTHRSGWWGVRNGVVVLWPGVTGPEMGNTFEIDDAVARPVFKKFVKDIIIAALKSKQVKRAAWNNPETLATGVH